MPVPGSTVEEKEVIEEGDTASAAVETSSPAAAMVETEVKVETKSNVMVPQSRIVAISVDNWKFTPNVITAKRGETVKVRLTGIAGTHGFAVPELGINTSIAAGKTVDVDLPTDAAGTFSFRCSIPCGSGHRDMTGTITIRE